MRDGLFAVFGIVLFVFIGNAQENESRQGVDFKSGSIKTSYNNEYIEYRFKSVEDLTEGIEEIVKGLDIDNPKKNKDFCEIEIELKLEMTVGVRNVLLAETIKTKCESDATTATVTKLKAIVYEASIGQ